jgi:hypothetical protein
LDDSNPLIGKDDVEGDYTLLKLLYRHLPEVTEEDRIVGSNPTQDIDICLRLFCVFVVLFVGSGLATG